MKIDIEILIPGARESIMLTSDDLSAKTVAEIVDAHRGKVVVYISSVSIKPNDLQPKEKNSYDMSYDMLLVLYEKVIEENARFCKKIHQLQEKFKKLEKWIGTI